MVGALVQRSIWQDMALMATAAIIYGCGTHGAAAADTVPSSKPLPDTLSGNECDAWNRYMPHIWQTLMVPPACDRVDPALLGLRPWLAANGFGISIETAPTYMYDILGHNHSPQQYGGQNPTTINNTKATLTYDLSRIGFSDGAQFAVQGTWDVSSYVGAAPRLISMTTLAIDQPLFNRTVELEYGYLQVLTNFYGFILGGNPTSAAIGPVSIIPAQLGVSQFEPTPTFELITRNPENQRWYNNAAITRSADPKGIGDDVSANPTGFALRVPGAGPLFIDEFGYKTSPGERDIWARAGVILNTSHYALWDGGESRNNYGGYLGLTYQLTQAANGPGGWSIDAKVDYAPPDRNLFNWDYQITLFDRGPLPGRPFDMLAFGYSQSFYSNKLRTLLEQQGQYAAYSSVGFSASYAFRAMRGTYLITSISTTTNPATVTPRLPMAVNFVETLSLSF